MWHSKLCVAALLLLAVHAEGSVRMPFYAPVDENENCTCAVTMRELGKQLARMPHTDQEDAVTDHVKTFCGIHYEEDDYDFLEDHELERLLTGDWRAMKRRPYKEHEDDEMFEHMRLKHSRSRSKKRRLDEEHEDDEMFDDMRLKHSRSRSKKRRLDEELEDYEMFDHSRSRSMKRRLDKELEDDEMFEHRHLSRRSRLRDRRLEGPAAEKQRQTRKICKELIYKSELEVAGLVQAMRGYGSDDPEGERTALFQKAFERYFCKEHCLKEALLKWKPSDEEAAGAENKTNSSNSSNSSEEALPKSKSSDEL